MAEEQDEPKDKRLTRYKDRNVEVYRDQFNALIKSKVIPPTIKTFEQAYTIAQFGKELGFSTVQSFHCIHRIEGKLTLNASGIAALLSRAGVKYRLVKDYEYVYEDGTYSYFSLKGKGDPIDRVTEIEAEYKDQLHVFRYTYSDAVRQKLDKKDNWVRMGRDMSRARCISKMGRFLISDHLWGLYTKIEIVDAGLGGNVEIVDTDFEEQIEDLAEEEEISSQNDDLVTDVDSEPVDENPVM